MAFAGRGNMVVMIRQKVSLKISPRNVQAGSDISDSVGLTATQYLPSAQPRKSHSRILINCESLSSLESAHTQLKKSMSKIVPEEVEQSFDDSEFDGNDSVIRELAEILSAADGKELRSPQSSHNPRIPHAPSVPQREDTRRWTKITIPLQSAPKKAQITVKTLRRVQPLTPKVEHRKVATEVVSRRVATGALRGVQW